MSDIGSFSKFPAVLCLGALFAGSGLCFADEILVDKIYHPYVEPEEKELEWRAIFQDQQPGVADHLRLYQLAYGRSLGEHWFTELYLLGKSSDTQRFDVSAYEFEARRQLTEQGQAWADWGLLFELEKETKEDIWVLSTAILVEKEWGKWSGTANFYIKGEWGADVKNEIESKLNLQARYRYTRAFEPAIEFYSGKDVIGLGPVFMGQLRPSSGNRLHWEAGLIFGLSDKSPNRTIRLLAEFEF